MTIHAARPCNSPASPPHNLTQTLSPSETSRRKDRTTKPKIPAHHLRASRTTRTIRPRRGGNRPSTSISAKNREQNRQHTKSNEPECKSRGVPCQRAKRQWRSRQRAPAIQIQPFHATPWTASERTRPIAAWSESARGVCNRCLILPRVRPSSPGFGGGGAKPDGRPNAGPAAFIAVDDIRRPSDDSIGEDTGTPHWEHSQSAGTVPTRWTKSLHEQRGVEVLEVSREHQSPPQPESRDERLSSPPFALLLPVGTRTDGQTRGIWRHGNDSVDRGCGVVVAPANG